MAKRRSAAITGTEEKSSPTQKPVKMTRRKLRKLKKSEQKEGDKKLPAKAKSKEAVSTPKKFKATKKASAGELTLAKSNYPIFNYDKAYKEAYQHVPKHTVMKMGTDRGLSSRLWEEAESIFRGMEFEEQGTRWPSFNPKKIRDKVPGCCVADMMPKMRRRTSFVWADTKAMWSCILGVYGRDQLIPLNFRNNTEDEQRENFFVYESQEEFTHRGVGIDPNKFDLFQAACRYQVNKPNPFESGVNEKLVRCVRDFHTQMIVDCNDDKWQLVLLRMINWANKTSDELDFQDEFPGTLLDTPALIHSLHEEERCSFGYNFIELQDCLNDLCTIISPVAVVQYLTIAVYCHSERLIPYFGKKDWRFSSIHEVTEILFKSGVFLDETQLFVASTDFWVDNILMVIAYRLLTHAHWEEVECYESEIQDQSTDEYHVMKRIAYSLSKNTILPAACGKFFMMQAGRTQNRIDGQAKDCFLKGQLYPAMTQIMFYVEKIYGMLLFLSLSRPAGLLRLHMGTLLIVFTIQIPGNSLANRVPETFSHTM